MLIKNSTIVSPEFGTTRAEVLVQDGKIKAIGSGLSREQHDVVIDASGLHLFPGFIDPHMHLGNYLPFEEDCLTESRAAASGGITTLLTFCKLLRHSPTALSYLEVLGDVVDRINRNSHVDVGLHCVVTSVRHLQEAAAYVARGMHSFKFYMTYRNDTQALRRGTVGVDDAFLFRGYQAIGEHSPPALAMTHCENDDLCRALVPERPGQEWSFMDWEASRPMFGETEAISRAVLLAEAARCPLYIVHVSNGDALEVVRSARSRTGQTLWVEVTPHYLTLTAEMCEDLPDPSLAKTCPPVRSLSEIEHLWTGIRDGTVDTIGSDHCAIHPSQKGNLATADAGFASVDVYPALILTEGQKRNIPLERLAAVTSLNPARIFGLYPQKGSLRPGADADFALIDLSARWTYRAQDSLSATKLSPYEGWQLAAKTRMTILRGQVIYDDGVLPLSPRGKALVRGDGPNAPPVNEGVSN